VRPEGLSKLIKFNVLSIVSHPVRYRSPPEIVGLREIGRKDELDSCGSGTSSGPCERRERRGGSVDSAEYWELL
jgi:hypothetical protein